MNKHKRPAWLAASIVSALLVALTAGAGAASASPCEADDHPFHGAGASLQNVAQHEWVPEWNDTFCGINPDVIGEYESIGSGAGLDKWGARPGSVHTWDPDIGYVGTDDPPTPANFANIEESAHGETEVVVVPVAQAAIALVVNLPEECELEEISNVDLEDLFEGEELTWEDIGATPTEPIEHPDACEVEITRVVRNDASGTTYQFKQYLHRINNAAHALPYDAPHDSLTWEQLQDVNETVEIASVPVTSANQAWPNPTEHLIRPGSSGGGAVVATVNNTDSTIGYASLSDVKALATPNNLTILDVDNGAEHASPEDGETVNCAGADYGIPLPVGHNADWTEVYGVDPQIGGSTYPLCTLTYVLALTDYEAGHVTWEGEEGHEIADNVHSFLEWVIDPLLGQEEIHDQGYGILPTAVRNAAAAAIGEIGEGGS